MRYIFTCHVNYQNIFQYHVNQLYVNLLNLRSKKLRKGVKENTIPFWAQPTPKFKFHSTEAQKIKEEKTEESLGLGKKSYGTKTDTET